MIRVITPESMQAQERAFIASGKVTGRALMERAAAAVAEAVLDMTEGGALFLVGPGNNGGDGYAAARLYAEQGRTAYIWTLSNPEMLGGDALENMERAKALGIPIRRIFSMPEKAPEGCAAVVDALFGTGLARPLRGLYAEAAVWINACGLPVLSVDMPSGTPELMVRADRTVTFHRMKPCHLLFPGRANAGAVTVHDISLPDEPHADDFTVLEAADVPALLPPRPPDAHKGACGHALLLTGARGMAGAAALCANAALRGGAGLVTVACPDAVLPTVQTLAPCAMCVSQADVSKALDGKSALAAGPGLGVSDDAGVLLDILAEHALPQVWDADALNWLAAHPRRLGPGFVITPHPGEAARLLGMEAKDITADPVAAAEALGARYGAAVLLKGATTVVLAEGQRALNITGTPGMATGGSGDVLTGLIAALLAQGLAPFDAARLGAYLHGKAGEMAAGRFGVRSMTATDLLNALRID